MAIVRRGFLRYTHTLGGRVLLALLGFWWIPTSWTTVRRGYVRVSRRCALRRVRIAGPAPVTDMPRVFVSLASCRAHARRMAAETPKAWPGAGVGSGDVIIANSQSYVDIVYLAFRFAPQFTEVVQVVRSAGTPTYRLRPISLARALRHAVAPPKLDAPTADGTYSLAEITAWAAAHGRGPVVVFPEVRQRRAGDRDRDRATRRRWSRA